MLLAIDPGPKSSGFVWLNDATDPPEVIVGSAAASLPEVLSYIYARGHITRVACEGVASYGMPVGRDVFDTCYVIGGITEACRRSKMPFELVLRKEVTSHLCHSAKATDANVAQAIRDMYPATGGGKRPEVGTKKKPGPLYGIKSHAWSALGVGLTAIARRKQLP